ncbi:MAG: ribosome-associated translation inhibitor RaiA [Candidatus Celaenobacter antarcticus]|nr:ribosome-associated translation inhibitor RaiA [Candidatus Celaenobacter antarcticus]MDP8315771.1 ribosome-associated translation inhibitor RaiA [Candidatus Celaenobacter antarcticus]
MQITITARHFELTDPIKDYADSAMRGLKRYFDNIIVAEMILRIEKNRNIAELNLSVKKVNFVAKAHEQDMYTAIDSVIRKIERQIKKQVGKMKQHHSNDKVALKELEKVEIATLNIIKKTIKPVELDLDRAIDEFTKRDNGFFLFKNTESDRYSMIKKIDDGYEVIEIQ